MEQQSKHTPGPWAVNSLNAQVDAFVGGNALPICQLLWPTKERTEAETEANACLIAAAPELLEALKAVIGEWREGYGLYCVDQVRTAIAKAEGR